MDDPIWSAPILKLLSVPRQNVSNLSMLFLSFLMRIRSKFNWIINYNLKFIIYNRIGENSIMKQGQQKVLREKGLAKFES